MTRKGKKGSGKKKRSKQGRAWSERNDASREGEQPMTIKVPQNPHRVLVFHHGATFKETTVYLTGHAYRNCRFERCTLVFSGWPSVLSGCSLANCALLLDVMIYDAESLKDLRYILDLTEGMFLEKGTNPTELPSSGVSSWRFDDARPPEEGEPQ